MVGVVVQEIEWLRQPTNQIFMWLSQQTEVDSSDDDCRSLVNNNTTTTTTKNNNTSIDTLL